MKVGNSAFALIHGEFGQAALVATIPLAGLPVFPWVSFRCG